MIIYNINDFITKCLDIECDEGNILFYRGENEKHDKLLPRVYQPQFNFIENEDVIYKEALSMFPSEMLAQKTTIEKLILMQHYGFPTRLLDISKNPLIALFFACYTEQARNKEDTNGVVYIFSVPKKEIKFCDSDAVSIIANLCKRSSSFSVSKIKANCKNADEREEFNENKEIQYLVDGIREEKPYFHNLVDYDDIISVKCLHPRMNNPRIIRQDGYFFVYGIDKDKKYPAIMNDKWILDTITISKDAKDPILEKLGLLNINETFVFPDYQHFNYALDKKYARQGNNT
ncbi:MAG: FRG domain-containing protein [Flavobacteriaceae bacterium]|jgi:hypothetical protein|nr:FRG domain-containing protein [Flavobacteriaceae bacterium]